VSSRRVALGAASRDNPFPDETDPRYLHAAFGLAARLARSSGQAAGTARNWATAPRLMSMLDAA
jgi:hypothetical protein